MRIDSMRLLPSRVAKLVVALVALIATDGITANLSSGSMPLLSSSVAEARFRGGGGRVGGGGYRVASRTTVRPGVGVTRSTTVAGGRYHYGAVSNRPGVYPGTVGTVRRVARRTARRTAYRTASGYSYYYGSPIIALPAPSCYAVMWEGMSAYNCGGIMYIYQDGQYYPIESD